MTLQVFRSLDRPSSFFGIRGRFLSIALYAMTADLVLSFFAGRALNSLIGVMLFLSIALAIYLGIIYIQGKVSEKTLFRRFYSRRMPGYIHFKPQKTYHLLLCKPFSHTNP